MPNNIIKDEFQEVASKAWSPQSDLKQILGSNTGESYKHEYEMRTGAFGGNANPVEPQGFWLYFLARPILPETIPRSSVCASCRQNRGAGCLWVTKCRKWELNPKQWL
eukprot:1858028-Amphidinium_carterae.1